MMESVPDRMRELLAIAADAVKSASRVLAVSHIDADGISALAIVVSTLQREEKTHKWINIHQLNSETAVEVRDLVREYNPDLVIFSDLGTGQMHLIQEFISSEDCVKKIVVLDHHVPGEERIGPEELVHEHSIVEINPWHHEMNGSYDLSGSGAAFLLAMALSSKNADLSELAIVGATGDMQDYYGKGFAGINKDIIEIGETNGFIRIVRDLTFFGINTRPLPFLLRYATEPYLPGITGEEGACYAFFEELEIPVKKEADEWRTWVDLEQEEKQKVIQKLIEIILEAYDNPRTATGIVGDVITLTSRPPRTDLRSAKEFSTVLNACGRNRRPEVGVRICLGDEEAIKEGAYLLQQHRANLAGALRRLEGGTYSERDGFYLVNDPETPDTIIGIVIGMAQGSRIVPIDKPIIGVATNTTNEGSVIKISGRAHKSLIDKGVSLRDVFTAVAEVLNEEHGKLVVEAGGHPMAAGAFVHEEHLQEFLDQSSSQLAEMMR